MAEPLVSVIVTTYNREEYLKETLKSILAQSFTDFELIVVDNFSNYDFFRVIEEMGDKRIHPFQNQNNGIIAVNRNFGLSKAVGKYVAFCDDDDLWLPEKLEEQVKVLSSNEKTICCSNLFYIDGGGSYIKTVIKKQYENPFKIYINNNICLSTVMVERSELVLFDETEIYKGIEDCGLWTKLIHNGYKVLLIHKPLINYRISGTNFSFNKRFEPIKRIALFSATFCKYRNCPVRYYVAGVLRDLTFFIYYVITKR